MKFTCRCLLLLLALFFACTSGGAQSRGREMQKWMCTENKVRVLCTTEMINDLVIYIGGSYITSLALITGNLNPHSYEIVKGDDEAIKSADIIFYNGLGLEHGASLIYLLEASPHAVALGNCIDPTLIHVYGNQTDPHIWMDISLWKNVLPCIVDALSRQDPGHASIFAQNAGELGEKMMQIHQQIVDSFQSIPQENRYFVTSHDAFHYFTRAYLASENEVKDGTWIERCAAPEGLSPDASLSSTDIQQIADYVVRHQIKTLFTESNVSPESIRKVVDASRQKGTTLRIAEELLYADAMGQVGPLGEGYLNMMRHNARVIQKYMR